MSKRKGVSADEKRTRMLNLFYEKKEFFSLKELEKIAPKEKGIIAQSVKEVVQSLVDDGLVDTDKIGTSIYFWAFPSKAKHTRKRKFDEASDRLEEAVKRLKNVKERLIEARVGREDTNSRQELLKKLQAAKLEEGKLLQEIQKFKDSDPEVLEQMKNEMKVLREAINRWTDNIFSLKSWCKNKFNIEENTLNKQFGIPPDLDYLD
ncbi:meiotic nuclear division protein 1 homolog [Homalodisca vitripennis]|uniref:Meiotic nuclear division protein 1 homolog n=1 Tax=Homalodisca liturata TaxID=320908 RepID=A0A1B6I389_9HEMI|nr:meiotic nuclear division protein 1 homolog [Homalodisca vitripennis]XP_046674235.1 meiotic nuclear division protein 1 homolog [Homalodisca vitripennis]KAG8276967.1 Meiotic nuclear division protein 1 [Homalodisca vitripennis]